MQSSLLFEVLSYDALKHREDLWDTDAVILDKSINLVFSWVCFSIWCSFLGRVLNSLFGKHLFCFMFMHFLVRGDAGLWLTPFNSDDKECWCIGGKATSWVWLVNCCTSSSHAMLFINEYLKGLVWICVCVK